MDFLLSPQGLAAAVALVFLAGLSEGVGTQGVVLLINRITPLAFVFGLLASALLFVLSAALWLWGVWLAATELFGVGEPLARFAIAVSAAYSPLLLSALALLPLAGTLIRQILRLWGFTIALGAISSLGLALWQAFLCAFLGAVLVAGASWVISAPSSSFVARLWAELLGRGRRVGRADPPRVIPGYEPQQEVRR